MPLLDLFLTMLWFFLFVVWIWLLITVYSDIFRSDDLSGVAKAAWVVFVLLLPYIGVLAYLIVRGSKMQERRMREAAAADAAVKDYIRDVSGTTSAADELVKLADLRDRGVITDAEFEAQKAKLLV